MEGIQKVYEFLEKAGTFYLATVEDAKADFFKMMELVETITF